MTVNELSPMYSVNNVRVRFQDGYFVLKGIYHDNRDIVCYLASPRDMLDENYRSLFVRMGDMCTVVQHNNYRPVIAKTEAKDWVVQLLRLALDVNVDASKLQGYLLKLGMNFSVRRNWFGGIEVEELKPAQLHGRDKELVGALLLNLEYEDAKWWSELKRLMDVGSGYRFTLKDILMKS